MNVIISQSLAMGLPVITTRHSGLPEQVIDGANGFLVPEGDYEMLAEKIIEMLEHPQRWAEFGRNGRAHIDEHYNIDRLTDQQIKIYEGLINQP